MGRFARLLAPLTLALAAACGTPAPTTPEPPPYTRVETPPARSAPASIQIPAINVDAPLVPLGLEPNGTVKVPDLNHVDQASWYCQDYRNDNGTPTCAGGGVIPGDTGPAAIYGHIDGHNRDGVFRHLPELNLGDQIKITRADGSVLIFKVYKVRTVPKSQFPSSEVYGNVQRPELRLITCTGDFIGGQVGYADQGIVYAALT